MRSKRKGSIESLFCITPTEKYIKNRIGITFQHFLLVFFLEFLFLTIFYQTLNRLDQLLTANGRHKTPTKTGTAISKYGDHTYLPKTQNVFVRKILAPLPTKGIKSNAFCTPYGRYSAIIIGPYTTARLNNKANTLLLVLADINMTTPVNPITPKKTNAYS